MTFSRRNAARAAIGAVFAAVGVKAVRAEPEPTRLRAAAVAVIMELYPEQAHLMVRDGRITRNEMRAALGLPRVERLPIRCIDVDRDAFMALVAKQKSFTVIS